MLTKISKFNSDFLLLAKKKSLEMLNKPKK